MADKRGRFQIYLKMVAGSFIRRKTRLLIIIFSIMLASSMVTSISSVYFDIDTKMKKEFRTYGANIIATPGKGNKSITAKEIKSIIASLSKDDIHAFSPVVYGYVNARDDKVVVSGVDNRQIFKVSPFIKIREGSGDFGENEALVGKTVSDKLALKPGSEIKLVSDKRSQIYKIIGVIETGSVEDDQVMIGINGARKLLGLKNSESAHVLYVSYAADHEEIVSSINNASKAVPGVLIKPINKISKSEGSVLNKISGLTLLVAVVIFISTIFSVAMTLMALVFERRKEIGLKKAIGASNRIIFSEFAGESVAMGIIGGAIGWITGLMLAQVVGQNIFNDYINIRIMTLPLSIGASLIIAIASSVLPIRMAMTIHPAVVLKDE